MKRAVSTLFVVMLAGASGLDPLYEDGAPLTSGWVLCCQSGAVNTCFCDDASSCQQNFFPCAAGACSASASCSMGADAGAAGGGGGAASGGGGGAAGGGTGTGGGGGIADAGQPADAGVSDAGVIDAGVIDAGTTDAGGASGPAFQFCCVLSRVTTCSCPPSGCVAEPFTPCPGGSCLAGTTSAICR